MSEAGNVKIYVDVKVNPTEDSSKVQVAVQRILGPIHLEKIDEEDRTYLKGTAEGLEQLLAFQELLRKERIRDAARRVLLSGLVGNRTVTFYLNKQVAYAGHISFSQPEGESPLGPIQVEVQCDNPRKLIDWLTPKTPKP
jgi:predicted RNA binding protein with dsRBD fold (UPF0201 family)